MIFHFSTNLKSARNFPKAIVSVFSRGWTKASMGKINFGLLSSDALVETIFLISHRTEIAQTYDNIIDVVKEDEFSQILT